MGISKDFIRGLLLILLLVGAYYTGYDRGSNVAELETCNSMGGTLYYVDNKGVLCLNGSIKSTQEGLYGVDVFQ